MIFDYTDYINRDGHKGLMNNTFHDNNGDLFYSKFGVCPFCNMKIDNIVHEKSIIDYPDWLDGSFKESEIVWQCTNCGWWEYKYTNASDAMNEGLRYSDIYITTSVLKKYKVGDKNIPIQILNDYIKSNPEKIYNIHYRKMEELTQSVFSEYYNCEVELVGKSHDGGKGLLMVYSDEPIIVQVKRRTQPDKVEAVSSIRELLGATQLAEKRSCIFVSTADHFSEPAVEAANKALELKLVDRYDLIDFHRFVEMLRLQKSNATKPWINLIRLKR